MEHEGPEYKLLQRHTPLEHIPLFEHTGSPGHGDIMHGPQSNMHV